VLTGFGLSFARALGEYGSIVFISGNLPFQTEIAPTLVVMRLDQFDYTGAISVALVLMIFSFALLLTSTRCKVGGQIPGTMKAPAVPPHPCPCPRRRLKGPARRVHWP
jgi:ABC-type sulfate transport system permease component